LETILLIVHLMIALALVGVVLLQKSEGGGLGFGGGTMGGVMTVRGTANLLTRATSFLATAFIVMSLTLAVVANQSSQPEAIVTDQPTTESMPAVPAEDSAPAVPLGD